MMFNEIRFLPKTGTVLTGVINFCLSLSLAIRWISNSYFPLSNLYESLIFLTWGLTLSHLILERQNSVKIIGAISTPIALFTIGFASLSLPESMKKAAPLVPALRSNWLMMHVSIMMISYAILITGCLLSVLFLIISGRQSVSSNRGIYKYKLELQRREEIDRQKDTASSSSSPASLLSRVSLLESIDSLSYRTIGLGFPLLTIGIIAGAVWANESWGSYWSWDPKETWALVTWLTFAAYLHSRLTKAWQGKKPAILASVGFIFVWICYLGVNFLGQGLHSYGWLS